MYIYIIFVAIIYVYKVIDGLMWVIFEKYICKTSHFFYFAMFGASALRKQALAEILGL